MTRGLILLWHGAIVDIPAGFILCDGNNGTPNLRDRFIIGAGSTHDPDDTGGANTHSHTGTTSVATDNLRPGTVIGAGANFDDTSSGHDHTLTTNEVSNVPPYFALAYVMKT